MLQEARDAQIRAYQQAKHQQLLLQHQEHHQQQEDEDLDGHSTNSTHSTNSITNITTTVPNPEDIEWLPQWKYLFHHDQEFCRRHLKIAVFQRESVEGASRRFINLPEVEAVLQEVTDEPIRRISTSSKTSVQDQAALFHEAFDILITPHGSQLVNMLFVGHKFTAFVEVSSVFVDAAPMVNGLAFAHRWVNSFGHLPDGRPDLLEVFEICSDQYELVACPYTTREEFKGSNLWVNTTIFRDDLEEAVEALCPDVPPGSEGDQD